MATDHERAVKAAEKTSDLLRVLFGRLGTQEHPRGRILSAYRQARRAIKGNEDDIRIVMDVLASLRASVEMTARDTLQTAADQGAKQAASQLAMYGMPASGLFYSPDAEYAAWMAQVEAQMSAITAVAMGAGATSQILGSGGRVGLMSPSVVIRDGARWLAAAAVAGSIQTTQMALERSGAKDEWGKQAIAAIDEKTTDCCLRVHGQVVPIDGEFRLTGTPRYADEMEDPPFHWYCRTSTALVRLEEQDDDLSVQMRDAARAEIDARGPDDERVEIHPAHARSRR